ncbi:MAG: hypothetical protein ACK5Y6_08905 [Pseudomonadota bacterium]
MQHSTSQDSSLALLHDHLKSSAPSTRIKSPGQRSEIISACADTKDVTTLSQQQLSTLSKIVCEANNDDSLSATAALHILSAIIDKPARFSDELKQLGEKCQALNLDQQHIIEIRRNFITAKCYSLEKTPEFKPWINLLSERLTPDDLKSVSMEIVRRVIAGELSTYDHLLEILRCSPHREEVDKAIQGMLAARYPSYAPDSSLSDASKKQTSVAKSPANNPRRLRRPLTRYLYEFFIGTRQTEPLHPQPHESKNPAVMNLLDKLKEKHLANGRD